MALLIDISILLLLAGTLGYAFLVDRRVRGLMAALRALEPVVGAFSEAVDRTETSVRALRADAPPRPAPNRIDEPVLTRTPAPHATPQAEGATELTFQSTRSAAPPLPPGMTRVTGKSDLVRGFFETARGTGA